MSIIVSIILFYTSIKDIKEYKIPNWCVLIIILIASYKYIFLNYDLNEFLIHLCIFIIVIFIGFFMFSVNVWGAGDAKLMSVLVFFVDLHSLLLFFMYAFIFSLFLGIFYGIFNYYFGKKNKNEFSLKRKIPFAPGIFLSFVVVQLVS